MPIQQIAAMIATLAVAMTAPARLVYSYDFATDAASSLTGNVIGARAIDDPGTDNETLSWSSDPYSKPTAPTEETTALLLQALLHPDDYKPSVTMRICVRDVFAYESAMSAGVSYRFHVRGAEISQDTQSPGWCGDEQATTSKPTTATKSKSKKGKHRMRHCADEQQALPSQIDTDQNFTVMVWHRVWYPQQLNVTEIVKA